MEDMHMGLRGPKPRISNIACVNEACTNYNKPETKSIVSNGTYATRSGKVRKYVCRTCGAVFCERQGTAFYDIRSPEDKVILALKLILQGLSLRGVSNALGVKLDTVRQWLARSARHAEQVNDVLIKEIKVNRVELDELWSFVRKKNFRAWQKARKKQMGDVGSGSLLHQNTV
jgi:transposase-like protein